jgi:hypothetical protein
MAHDHPGFEYWETDDPAHPFPVGDIDFDFDDSDGMTANVDLTPPKKQPKPRTVAERSIGIPMCAQMWIALECSTDAQGKLVYEAVFRARHVHWYPQHGETGIGPVQEIRVAANKLAMWGSDETLAAHGQHCDLFHASWAVQQSVIRLQLFVQHFEKTVAKFLADRERSREEAERMPPLRPSRIVPDEPLEPPPPPPPEVPGGALITVLGGLFGGLLALVKRAWRAAFG